MNLITHSALWIFSFLSAFFLSTLLINWLSGAKKHKKNSKNKSTGIWIGLCETLIIYVLVANHEFSALAIIFGAKEYVRKEKIVKNPSYYLLGTLINLGVALFLANFTMWIIPILNDFCK